MLRWLSVVGMDVQLVVNAVSRKGETRILTREGEVLCAWIPQEGPSIPFEFHLLRSDIGADTLRNAMAHCAQLDDPPLAVELLMEAEARYLQFDYRMCVLSSVLALERV